MDFETSIRNEGVKGWETLRIPPYILPPYEERYKKIGLEKMATLRSAAREMMGFEFYNGYISDTN